MNGVGDLLQWHSRSGVCCGASGIPCRHASVAYSSYRRRILVLPAPHRRYSGTSYSSYRRLIGVTLASHTRHTGPLLVIPAKAGIQRKASPWLDSTFERTTRDDTLATGPRFVLSQCLVQQSHQQCPRVSSLAARLFSSRLHNISNLSTLVMIRPCPARGGRGKMVPP